MVGIKEFSLSTLCVISLLFSTHTQAMHKEHNLGISLGKGTPHNIHGFRLQYRHLSYDHSPFKLFTDISYAYWRTNAEPGKQFHVIAIAPVVRIRLLANNSMSFYFEGSVGPAYKTKRHVGANETGSRFTFQDMLGFGFQYNKTYEIRFHYFHYSNAGLAKPNPGTDFKPMISFGYNF